jgi:hypothetical protein
MKLRDVVWYLKSAAAVMAIVIANVLYGVALAILWGWFVVPLGVRDVNVAQAIGISLVVSLVVRTEPNPEVEEMSFGERYLYAFVTSLTTSMLVLALGGVIHLLA